jgi:predicted DNA-binding antitoxin AbrB/MazE fold protein
MTTAIQAVYERGVFRPLKPVELTEGQRVTLSVEPFVLSPEEAEARLQQWQQVYGGLSEEEVADVERIALDRRDFFRERG